ncbi:MAG: thermonuclease family protein [Rhizobiaceae bacterium]|nr:MAG: thermonuclease family protein [Rhizobiaceae bacterium]CAG1015864.1 hypothetical protein RHIZO_05178 [Rhizobiaceae bacterium]
MRPVLAAAAVLAIGLAGTMLSLAGRTLLAPDSVESASTLPEAAPTTLEHASTGPLPAADDAGSSPPRRAAEGRTLSVGAGPARGQSDHLAQAAPPRAVAPEIVAPPPLDPAELQRAEPRQPLSDLALALPPKPVPPDKWKGSLLHRPVAVASARFEAMGRSVALAGIESVEPDEACSWQGRPWPCGVRARTAFRTWLRGRSLSCAIPPESDRHLVVAACRLGKQDVGLWLVTNGWARAAEGGPYEAAGRAAREKQLGVFGAPPAGVVPESSYQLPPSSLPETELPDFDRLEAAPAGELAPDAASDAPASEGPG